MGLLRLLLRGLALLAARAYAAAVGAALPRTCVCLTVATRAGLTRVGTAMGASVPPGLRKFLVF